MTKAHLTPLELQIEARHFDEAAHAYFSSIWTELLLSDGKQFQPSVFETWFRSLKGRQGWYHSWSHLIDLELALKREGLSLQKPTAFMWALLFHDVVYNPGRRDNEVRSAGLAKSCLEALGFSAEFTRSVERLIEATRDHGASGNRESADPDLKYFLDLDMSILAARPAEYNAYLQGLHREFSWTPLFLFARKRKQWLRRKLAEPSLFLTPHFRDRYEERARKNLTAELRRAWGIWKLKGLYDPSLHRMDLYLQAKEIFNQNRTQWLLQHRGQVVILGANKSPEFHFPEDEEVLVARLDDESFCFPVQSLEEEENLIRRRYSNVYEALIQNHLDTDVPAREEEALRALQLRGVSDAHISFLQFLIATGAWWNIYAWEWGSISFSQFKKWLRLNSVPAGVLGFLGGVLLQGVSLVALAGLLFGVGAALLWGQFVLLILRHAQGRFFSSEKSLEEATRSPE